MDEIVKQIEEFIKYVNTNPYIIFLMIVVAVAGLLFNWYSHASNKRIKHLESDIASVNMIQHSQTIFPKLDIKYDNKPLTTLTSSKLVITNRGNESIKKSDVAPLDPIRVSVGSDEQSILDFGILRESNSTNNFTSSRVDDKTIEFNFDYVDPDDYAIFQIIHTGDSSESLKVTGTVIGSTKPLVSKDRKSVEQMFRNPFIRIAFSSMKAPRLIASIVYLMIIGFLIWAVYAARANIILAVFCALPLIYMIWGFIQIIIRPARPERQAVLADFMQSMMDSMLNETRKTLESSRNTSSKKLEEPKKTE
jgi:hypothetical protein